MNTLDDINQVINMSVYNLFEKNRNILNSIFDSVIFIINKYENIKYINLLFLKLLFEVILDKKDKLNIIKSKQESYYEICLNYFNRKKDSNIEMTNIKNIRKHKIFYIIKNLIN